MKIFITLVTFLVTILSSNAQTTTSDIVVVGGGTAGCILAARLCAAFPNQKVIVLERGLPRSPNADFLVSSPRNLFNVWSDRSTTEGFSALPDAGLNGRSTFVLTGATLGGSSTIAGFQWTLPIDGTVERWRIQGLNTRVSKTFYQRAFDTMGFAAPRIPLNYADDYVQAAVKAGLTDTSNPVSPPFRYVWQNRIATNEQSRRRNACSVYLTPLQQSGCAGNLEVIQGVTASKLLMKPMNTGKKGQPLYRVFGVETISTENKMTKRRFIANREVIVSAGPYGSPKLLQLSGIGSSSTLKAAGVQQKINLPAGERTICRASAGVISTYSGVPDEPTNNVQAVNSAQQRAIWDAGKGGLLAVPVTAANGRTGLDAYFVASTVPFLPGKPQVITNCYHNTDSTGFVRINGSNPFTTPLVNYNLLGSKQDVAKLSSCLRFATKIHNSFPAKFKLSFMSPADGKITEEYVRTAGNTGAHFVGGCPVGDVLTSDLRVKGTSGLRVIDASSLGAMPLSSGPVSSVYMLGEYMSSLLIQKYKAMMY